MTRLIAGPMWVCRRGGCPIKDQWQHGGEAIFGAHQDAHDKDARIPKVSPDGRTYGSETN